MSTLLPKKIGELMKETYPKDEVKEKLEIFMEYPLTLLNR